MRLSEIYTSIQGEGPNAGSPTQFIRFAGCNLKCPGWPCDTQHAIDPKLYRKEWVPFTVDELSKAVGPWPRAVTLTGGEPLLQPKEELEEFVSDLWCSYFQVHVIMDWKLNGSGEDAYNDVRYSNVPVLECKDAVKFVCASKEDYRQALRIYDTLEERIEGIGPQFYLGAAWGKVKESELAAWMIEDQIGPQWKMNVQVHNYIWERDERAR
jgi:7-carboxy-7-deazaguanine synthase